MTLSATLSRRSEPCQTKRGFAKMSQFQAAPASLFPGSGIVFQTLAACLACASLVCADKASRMVFRFRRISDTMNEHRRGPVHPITDRTIDLNIFLARTRQLKETP